MRNIILIAVSILLFGCNNHNGLIGKWEEINQADLTKAQIELYKLGEDFFGKKIQLSKLNKESGWAVDDVCWKDIKWKETNVYAGTGIAKRLNNGLTETMTYDFVIRIENEDLISVKPLYTDNKLMDGGKILLLKRIK